VSGGSAAGDLDRLDDGTRYNFGGSAAAAVLIGVGLAWTARTGATALLIAVAAVQALLAFSWSYGLRVPGRLGGVVIAAMAAASTDVAVSVWPHSRLAAQLAVLGLAVPVMFVHQLVRGAGRVRVGESFGAIALLVVAEAALPALLQLRHEFTPAQAGGDAVFATVVVAAGALVVGYFTDMLVATPRFDAEVPRGLLAVVASAAVGAVLGHLTLRNSSDFVGGRSVFVGAALGALVALLAVAVAFAEHGVPLAESGFPRRSRPLLSVLMPMALLAPVAFLVCLAIRA
jgi:hypothetical protein